MRGLTNGLTEKQAAMLAYIVRHTITHGREPTIRDLMAEFDLRSPNGPKGYLAALAKKGWIAPADGRHGVRLARQVEAWVETDAGTEKVLWPPVLPADVRGVTLPDLDAVALAT